MSILSEIKLKANIIPALFHLKTIIKKMILSLIILGSSIAVAQSFDNYSDTQTKSLFSLIMADIAGDRNLDNAAITNYLQAAQNSHDPEIARLATEFAIDKQNINLARQASNLWAKLAPKDFRANLVAATLQLDVSSDQAKSYLVNALKIDSELFYHEITDTYQMLSQPNQLKLSDVLLKLSSDYPKNEYLLLGTAYIVAQHDMIATAEKLTNSALKLNPKFSSAIELKAKLIRFKYKSDQPALEYLAESIKKVPNNNRLKLFYASALIDNNQATAALKYLKEIGDDKEFGAKGYITIGKVYLDQNQLNNAKIYFNKLDKYPEFWSSGKYFLAQIAEKQKDPTKAIGLYKKVYDGPFHITSFIRAALLLSLDSKYDQAINILDNARPTNIGSYKKIALTKIEILIESSKYEQALNEANRALEIIPSDIDILYSRSLIAGYLDNITLAEEDLSKILSLNPNHANALNALGFTLSHIPDRRNDARAYLERAIKIAPNNPNFIDSMGWLLYQMGELDKAITLLEKAYKLSKDIDISLHYSQALWKKGKKQQAISILSKALTISPNNKALKEALSNFQSNLTSNIKDK